MDRVAIVGGGISGLATAYYLAEAGFRPVLFERADQLGGLIKTESVNGCQLESGPDSYIAAKTAATELAGELGISNSIIGSQDASRRIFIVRKGRMVQFPRGMVMLAPAEWGPALLSPLFSLATKARFLGEVFSRPRTRLVDVPVRDLVRDHFGREVLEYVAEPLLSGVYGGDAGKLSAQSVLPRFIGYEQQLGSLIRGVRLERRQRSSPASLFQSFRGGMGQLISALATSLEGRYEWRHTEVSSVEWTGACWRVNSVTGAHEADHVVFACQAHVMAKLISSVRELASEADAIPYSSAILVTLVYSRAEVNQDLDGFGFLVPAPERRTVAAGTFIHNKFHGRIPAGQLGIRVFVIDPEASALERMPDHEVVTRVRQDLQRLLSVGVEPQMTFISRWPQSMPQYVIGHEERRKRIERVLARSRGLHVVSNWLSGVGVPDCIRAAKETANLIANEQTS